MGEHVCACWGNTETYPSISRALGPGEPLLEKFSQPWEQIKQCQASGCMEKWGMGVGASPRRPFSGALTTHTLGASCLRMRAAPVPHPPSPSLFLQCPHLGSCPHHAEDPPPSGMSPPGQPRPSESCDWPWEKQSEADMVYS